MNIGYADIRYYVHIKYEIYCLRFSQKEKLKGEN